MLKDKIKAENLNLYYGEHHALKDVSMNMKEQAITALIGPSGCGKSTFLKTLNRMNDLIPSVKIDGSITINEENIYDPRVDVTLLRKKVGMVFQQPNPFPMSIYDNITYGPKIHGIKSKERLDEIVEKKFEGGSPLGRSKRPFEKAGTWNVRRTAAASLYCKSIICRTRGTFNG